MVLLKSLALTDHEFHTKYQPTVRRSSLPLGVNATWTYTPVENKEGKEVVKPGTATMSSLV